MTNMDVTEVGVLLKLLEKETKSRFRSNGGDACMEVESPLREDLLI